MKKILLTAAYLFFAIISYAVSVPQIVKDQFAKKFSEAKDVKWSKENKSEYEAEFNMNGKKYSANYSIKGEWMETEEQISTIELPEAVTAAVKKSHPKSELVDADRITNSKGALKYEVVIKSGINKQELLFDAAGNTVK